jgi:hypothetical protein
MSFSTDMDRALNGMDTDHKTAVKSAFTTMQTAVAAEQVSYGSPAQEQIWLNEQLLELARGLTAQMMDDGETP